MPWKVSPEDFLAQHNSAELPTIPETEDTLDIQLKQLGDGARNVVMVPISTPMPPREYIPRGSRQLYLPQVGRFIFNDKVSPREIKRAAKFNRLPDILGAADGGMGSADKSKLSDDVAVVTGQTDDGVSTQSTVTDKSHLPATVEQTKKVTPKRGKLLIEKPDSEISRRLGEILAGM